MFDLTLSISNDSVSVGPMSRKDVAFQTAQDSQILSRSASTKRKRSSPAKSMTHTPERESLEATLRRAAAGDELAWRDLVQAYSNRVFGLIRAQCNSSDLAEEITQSTFCTIVVKIGGYTELGKFEQWLFRIAMNRLRDEMRRRKRQARPVDNEAMIGLAGADSHAPNEHAPTEPAEYKALRSALAQLSDADQQIIHLRHYGGLSFKQISEILEQPLGTVLARQHRALKKLAELMGGVFGQQMESDD